MRRDDDLHTLPDTRVPLVFCEGERRLVGRVEQRPPQPGPLDPPVLHPPPSNGVGLLYDARTGLPR